MNVNTDEKRKNNHVGVEGWQNERNVRIEPVDPHSASFVSNPIFDNILDGWFSEFQNGMTPIHMRVQTTHPYRLRRTMRWKAILFLQKLRGHYKFFTDLALPATEFLINFFLRYPKVSEEDFRKAQDAINQIYDGLEILRPSEQAAITARVVAQEKARHISEVLDSALAA